MQEAGTKKGKNIPGRPLPARRMVFSDKRETIERRPYSVKRLHHKFCAEFSATYGANISHPEPKPKKEKKWAKLQWISTALLWVSWLLQDSANIAIFLPRKLSIYEFMAATSIVVFAMAMIILSNGGTIQEVVTEKSDIAYSKAATLVDIAYATVLIVFQKISRHLASCFGQA